MEKIKDFFFSPLAPLSAGLLSFVLFYIFLNSVEEIRHYDDILFVFKNMPKWVIVYWFYAIPIYAAYSYIAGFAVDDKLGGLHNLISFLAIFIILIPLVLMSNRYAITVVSFIGGAILLLSFFGGWGAVLGVATMGVLAVILVNVFVFVASAFLPLHALYLFPAFIKGCQFIFFAEPLELAVDKVKEKMKEGNLKTEEMQNIFANAFEEGNKQGQFQDVRAKKMSIAGDNLKDIKGGKDD